MARGIVLLMISMIKSPYFIFIVDYHDLIMTLKVKYFNPRYLSSKHCSNTCNGQSNDQGKLFNAILRKIPEEKFQIIKSFLISKAENLVIEGKLRKMSKLSNVLKSNYLQNAKKITLNTRIIIFQATQYIHSSQKLDCVKNRHFQMENN